MICPLCNSSRSRPHWMGATVYDGVRFEYQECLECRSAYVFPMPDRTTLEKMYGDEYGKFISADEAHGGERGVEGVLRQLGGAKAGNFLDYGCGGRHLLRAVSRLGWNCYGVEFGEYTVESNGQGSSLKIFPDLAQLPNDFMFDVIHMGDVIEHLTEVNLQMPEILDYLKPGGMFIAQGPLEANFNLFLIGLRLKKAFRNSDSSMPPYHVMLATSEGQRKFFSRFSLIDVAFDVSETVHPAPERIGLSDIANFRMTALFMLRKVSQTFSSWFNSSAGNRYFYVGRKTS